MAVLVVFFFFLIFGASFYFKLQEASLKRQMEENTQLKVIQIAQKSLTMPELECSRVGVARENCVDILKVQEFQQLLVTDPDARVDYFNVFENSHIRVVEVYPEPNTWEIYENEKGEESRIVQIPILIYVPHSSHYAFGYLEVRVFA